MIRIDDGLLSIHLSVFMGPNRKWRMCLEEANKRRHLPESSCSWIGQDPLDWSLLISQRFGRGPLDWKPDGTCF